MYNLIEIAKNYAKEIKLNNFKRLNYSKYRGDKKLNEMFDRYKADFDSEDVYKIQRWTKEGWYTYDCYPTKGYLQNLIYIVEYYLFVNPREKVRIIDYTVGKIVYD